MNGSDRSIRGLNGIIRTARGQRRRRWGDGWHAQVRWREESFICACAFSAAPVGRLLISVAELKRITGCAGGDCRRSAAMSVSLRTLQEGAGLC